jgi:hypothetical protein
LAGKQRASSKLVPLGFALMIVGIAFPRGLTPLAGNLEPGLSRQLVLWLIGLLYVGFVFGLVAAVVGLLRNRRVRRM